MLLPNQYSYGYPVLRSIYKDTDPDELDFPRIDFQPSIGFETAASNLERLTINYTCDCPVEGILNELKNENVVAYLKVFCRATFFSKLFSLALTEDEFDGEIEFDTSEFAETIEASILFIAAKDLCIKSDQMHADFSASNYTVAKGDVLAESSIYSHPLEPLPMPLGKSVFKFEIDDEKEDGAFSFDYDSDFVCIYANEKYVEKFRGFEDRKENQALIASALYAPIASVLIEKILDPLNEDQLGSLKWYKSFEQSLQSLPLTIKNEPLAAAHKIMVNPLSELKLGGK